MEITLLDRPDVSWQDAFSANLALPSEVVERLPAVIAAAGDKAAFHLSNSLQLTFGIGIPDARMLVQRMRSCASVSNEGSTFSPLFTGQNVRTKATHRGLFKSAIGVTLLPG